MATFTALTTLHGQTRSEALGEAMDRLSPAPTGVGVLDLDDGSGLFEVGGYFTARPDADALALLAAAFGAQPFGVSQLPEIDWVAHVCQQLAPVRAGRFFVYGSHDSDKLPGDAVPLLIEAAMAFGTGHHGTTLGCLLALDGLIKDGFAPDRIADIGCGTAVLALAGARIWDATIVASDIDPVAVEVAEANLRANGMPGRVRCLEAAGFDHPELQQAAPFDLIFANILKGPLVALAPDVASYLCPGGFAILSGILNEQATDIVDVYARSGINLRKQTRIGDWTTLVLQKMA